jgi:hypothetical protein
MQNHILVLLVSLLLLAFSSRNGLLKAQTLEKKVGEVSVKRSWPRVVLSADQSKMVLFQGWILAEGELAPLERAGVRLMRGHEVVDGTLSDLEGYFSLKIPQTMRQDTSLRLVISFLGRTISEIPLPQGHAEVALVVSASMELDPIEIWSEEENWGITDCPSVMPYCGKPPVTMSSLEVAKVRCVIGFRREPELLYRPLDEYLMMHSSEIHHNGRW